MMCQSYNNEIIYAAKSMLMQSTPSRFIIRKNLKQFTAPKRIAMNNDEDNEPNE